MGVAVPHFLLPMRRSTLVAALVAAALAAFAPPALAHEGNPNFESLVTAIEGAEGLDAQVLNGDDRLLLINTSRRTVLVQGYDDEPYGRLLPDGAVEVNRRSTATYLNEERFADVDVPATADNKAEPEWEQRGRNGRFDFHDHRIHWMVKTDPPQVKDKSKRTKVTDWEVPLRVDGKPAAVKGTLWWRGRDSSGVSTPIIIGGGALVLSSFGLMVVVLRRRQRGSASAAEEAW